MILRHLGIPLSHEDGFMKVNNSYFNTAYCNICDDYGVNMVEIWKNCDWFYTTAYSNFDDGGKAIQSSPPKNRTRWMTSQSKGFMKKDIGKLSRSVQAYVYLVLVSQVQAKSNIVGNSASGVDAQQVF